MGFGPAVYREVMAWARTGSWLDSGEGSRGFVDSGIRRRRSEVRGFVGSWIRGDSSVRGWVRGFVGS